MTEIKEEVPGLSNLAAHEQSDEVTALEQLAAKRRVLVETKEVNIPVPGYDKEPPLLLVRYRLLEGSEIERIGNKVRREVKSNWQRQIHAAIETFVSAIVGFYVDLGDGNIKELTKNGQHITRFNETLAKALEFSDELPDQPTDTQVAFSLFNNNDAAISQHAFLLNSWFNDTSLDVTKEYLGNL